MTNRYDIVTNVFKTYPYGLTCEIIKLSLFKKMKKNKIRKKTLNIFLIIFIE